ncbi:Geranylgeranyl pyrophosphate synthase [Roseovarius mucosus DSM 17069]|uniref:Geranylgeranyl diphosphate synthase n=1 Tax=Roseovarius mucosus DSM 17069 TaxID=1288298 RepID=A0A0A0HP85_9RHOB|nr:farnesyl diphosphate synthase [Roseovarius mucosus]KGM88781.1 Geranylgeranyl pyrophosphate synthase [Roseovarius mucosus DSM 17069]
MQARLAAEAEAIQAHLNRVLAPFGTGPVAEGMRYATRGGKRIRGFLVMESARLHDVPASAAIWPATAIEALHAYSLVHDDLPAMDNDDLRRGQPTVHVKWDEATAILVGDALQSLAFELVAHPDCGPAEARADLALSLARAAGGQGMVLGQALDIAAETATTPLTLDEITTLQAGKTGALIQWSATAGAFMAQADSQPLDIYARALGLAFQIQDDVIDVTGDAASAGKAVGKDAAAGKATFVSLLGLEGARARSASLVDEACDALSCYGANADALRDLARFVISRQS